MSQHDPKSSSSSCAITLRAMAQDSADAVCEFEAFQDFPRAAEEKAKKAACEAGAQAWEIVSALTKVGPWRPVYEGGAYYLGPCHFCGAEPDPDKKHDDTCLWVRAKTLVDDSGLRARTVGAGG